MGGGRISWYRTLFGGGGLRFALPPSPLPLGRPRLLVAAWLVTIFTLSSYPYLSPPGEFLGRDKLAHLVTYAVLGHLLGNAAWERPADRRRARFLLFLALGVAWGGFDELYQSLVPGRSSSGADLIADACGVTIGILTSWRAEKPAPGPAAAAAGKE
jgi:VanZ family protein